MKEPTIEQKAKRFDEVLAMAKECITYVPDDAVNKYMLNMFPELRESEDERIRKELIYHIQNCDDTIDEETEKRMVAWLEKQGTSYTRKDVDDAYLKGVTDTKNEIEKQYEANYQIRKDIATFIFNYRGDIKDRAKWMNYLGIKVSFVEKQDEQKPQGKSAIEAVNEEKVDNQNCIKPIDKVEPKFHKGDWIISDTANKDYRICKITDVKDGNYAIESIYGYKGYNQFDVFDNTYRLWDITKDAKDGDVLVSQYGRPFIYNDNRDSILIGSYCGISVDGNFVVATKKCHWTENKKIHPATKEQRDTLIKAMADAGYTFDFEKKELKKIEPKPTDEEMKEILRAEYEKGRADAIAETQVAWSEEDKRHVGSILERLEGMCKKGATFIVTRFAVNQDIDWLKSLKPQPKQEWDEDDSYMLEQAIKCVNNSGKLEVSTEEIEEWLKALKKRMNK